MLALIAEGMHPSGISLLAENGVKTVTPKEPYINKAVEALIVRSVFPVDAKALQRFPNLKMVAKLGTGLDNIDLGACRLRNIRVIHTPGLNAVSTAEFAVMQVLAFYKRAYRIQEGVRGNDFRRALYAGRELSGLTAGVIGYGNVGKNIVERLSPFVKKIHVYDQNQQSGDLDGLLKNSDMILLAVSLAGNEEMVNRSFLARVRPDVLLVNIARGALVCEPDLVEFLKINREAFYVCDVLKEEPDYSKAPELQDYYNLLLQLPNVFYTPHVASLTGECQEKIAIKIAQEVIHAQ